MCLSCVPIVKTKKVSIPFLFFGKSVDERDFELLQMITDSFYIELWGEINDMLDSDVKG